MMFDLRDYRKTAERYRPDKIRVLFIAESPPGFTNAAKKSYFYFDPNPGMDILFTTIVKALYDIDYIKKDGHKAELLKRLQADGYWLMDAVEYPINIIDGHKTYEDERATEITANIESLLSRLGALRRNGILLPDAGIILIKRLVFKVLTQPLTDAGYWVLNNRKIKFPKYQRDRDTINGIRDALANLQN